MFIQKFVRLNVSFIVLITMLVLVACQSDEHSDTDSYEADLTLYTDDVELQADKILIWWNGDFNAPHKDYMGEYLHAAFDRDKFEINDY